MQTTRIPASAPSQALVDFTSDYLIEQMAPRLKAAGITGREAAVACLLEAGFGKLSVNALVDRALVAARG